MKPANVIILLAQAGIKPVRLHYPADGKEDNEIWLSERTCVYVSQVGYYATLGTMTAAGLQLRKPQSMLHKPGRRRLLEAARVAIIGDLDATR